MPIELNKKTIVSTSIGSLMAMGGGLWMVAGDFNEAVAKIDANSKQIESLQIRTLDFEIALAKKEIRELKRELRVDPSDPYLLEDMDEVQDKLDGLIMVRDCRIDPNKDVCQ